MENDRIKHLAHQAFLKGFKKSNCGWNGEMTDDESDQEIMETLGPLPDSFFKEEQLAKEGYEGTGPRIYVKLSYREDKGFDHCLNALRILIIVGAGFLIVRFGFL